MKKRSPNIRNKLIQNLRANPEKIMMSEVAVKNKDILELLELSGKENKKEALFFAIEFTIDSLRGKSGSKSDIESKLEVLRYGRKDAHEASNELLDTDAANRHCQGKFKC